MKYAKTLPLMSVPDNAQSTDVLLFEKLAQTTRRPLWTVDDVAIYLSVSKRTVRDWLYLKKIPARRINGCVRFSPDEIERWTLQQIKE